MRRRRVAVWQAEWVRRTRRRWSIWQRRDPKTLVIAVVGMALGLCLFLLTMVWVEVLRLVVYLAKTLR